jgi:hypothetical protein
MTEALASQPIDPLTLLRSSDVFEGRPNAVLKKAGHGGDLYFPPLASEFGPLEWTALEPIADHGLRPARHNLEQWSGTAATGRATGTDRTTPARSAQRADHVEPRVPGPAAALSLQTEGG